MAGPEADWPLANLQAHQLEHPLHGVLVEPEQVSHGPSTTNLIPPGRILFGITKGLPPAIPNGNGGQRLQVLLDSADCISASVTAEAAAVLRPSNSSI